MREFLNAALPWVILGVAVAILAVRHTRQNKKAAEKEENPAKSEKPDTYMTEAMAIGMCLGVCVGSIRPDFLSIGLGIGTALGLAVGACIKKKPE